MSLIQPQELNKFRLILDQLAEGDKIVYQENTFDVSTIMLSAHIANLSNSTQRVTVRIRRGTNDVIILKNAAIPAEETLNPFAGRVVLEAGDEFIVSGSTSDLSIALSVLENANT